MGDLNDPARVAAAAAAAELVEPDMLIGLGSGRAVWKLTELLGARGDSIRAATASSSTAPWSWTSRSTAPTRWGPT